VKKKILLLKHFTRWKTVWMTNLIKCFTEGGGTGTLYAVLDDLKYNIELLHNNAKKTTLALVDIRDLIASYVMNGRNGTDVSERYKRIKEEETGHDRNGDYFYPSERSLGNNNKKK
jgi:hypothetical protein